MTGYEVGVCPKCKTPIFDYGDIAWYDNSIGQDFICKNCNLKGTEYYNISFDCIELESPELNENKQPLEEIADLDKSDEVIDDFKNKDEMYNYVITLIQENVANNEELLDKCRQILDKGAIATLGADVMKTFYEKFKDKIEQRINELGEEYIGAVLAEYVFEDVVYGLEDNLQDTLA